MESEEIRSFNAGWYKPSFAKRERRAYGMGRRVWPYTFVLARREWDGRWEELAMSAIFDALRGEGLSRASLLDGTRWHPESPPDGTLVLKRRALLRYRGPEQ